MKVTTEELPDRQVKIEIEVDEPRHEQAMEQAFKKLAPQVKIKGFRAGKAPKQLIKKEIGHHRLLDEAMDILVPETYQEAIEQESITPVSQPAVELVSHEPLVFTAMIPLEPIVDLGDYNALRVPREFTLVTDEQIDAAMMELRRRHGTLEPVDRAAVAGDVLSGSLKAEAEGVDLVNQEDIEFRLSEETFASLPELFSLVVGMKKGEELEKTVTAPEDFADAKLAGNPIAYNVVIKEVKEEILAEENDEFAKSVEEDIEDLAALKEKVRAESQKTVDDEALKVYETACLEALTELAKSQYPPVMVDSEITHLLEDQAGLDPRDPRAQEFYLSRAGKDEDEVKELVRPEAELRLRRSLVLSHFAEAEDIAVEESDIDAEVETMAGTAGEQSDAIRLIFGGEQGRDNLRRSLLTRKTFARMVEITGADSKPAAAPKKKTKAKASAKEPAAGKSGKAEKPAKTRRTSPRKTE